MEWGCSQTLKKVAWGESRHGEGLPMVTLSCCSQVSLLLYESLSSSSMGSIHPHPIVRSMAPSPFQH